MRVPGGRYRARISIVLTCAVALIAPFAVLARSASAGRTARAVATPSRLNILVLGDSYSAGNGAGDYYGPKGCWRSRHNYAEVFASSLRVAPYRQPTDVANAACSGAVTDDVFNSRDGR